MCSFCWNFTKIFWFSYFVEFVLGRFSHFNIAIAYSNSKFCGVWTPSFCEFTCNLGKTSTPLIAGKLGINIYIPQNHKPYFLPGVCSFCWNLTKIFWVSYFVEFVLGRFSHFNIAIAYSNSKFCSAWTPSFCQLTCNFGKTSTPQPTYDLNERSQKDTVQGRYSTVPEVSWPPNTEQWTSAHEQPGVAQP